jgi:hypothetical protein
MNGKNMKDLMNIIVNLEGKLPDDDINSIKEFYDYGEYGLAAVQIADRLHDLDIKIDKNFADLIANVCNSIGINDNEWSFIYELTSKQGDVKSRIINNEISADIDDIGSELTSVEFVKKCRLASIPELMIVRELRSRFDLSFEDASAMLSD